MQPVRLYILNQKASCASLTVFHGEIIFFTVQSYKNQTINATTAPIHFKPEGV